MRSLRFGVSILARRNVSIAGLGLPVVAVYSLEFHALTGLPTNCRPPIERLDYDDVR